MRYLYKLALTSILVIIFSSCYGQRKKLDCLISEVNKLQNDFFVSNECDELSDSQLLYFANQERKKLLNILQDKFPELRYLKKQEDIILIESNYVQSANFYNFLIFNDNVYTYHLKQSGKEMEKISISEFIKDPFDNFVVIDILTHKNNFINSLPKESKSYVIGGGCYLAIHITWNTKKPNFKMALFEEYSSFK